MDDLEYNLLTLFADGGLMMYFLVLCSLVALGVIIAKSYTLWLAHKDTETVLAEVQELSEQGRLDEAIQRCIETPGPTAAILLAGLRRIKDGKVKESELEQAINTTGTIELGFLERGLVILATVANVAPLMGFLGTVAGMIMAFESIAVAGDVDPTLVAGGIKVALLTTATGLLIAIPTNIGYNFFVTRIDRLILDMEQGTQQLLNLVWDMDRRGDLQMVRQGGAPAAAMAGAGVGAAKGRRAPSQASRGEPASPPAPTADESVKKNKPGN
ncbi:MAG: MotA/TolQ/ExbB proton channel family protein [Gemmatimonadales bacterium]|nr:MAG: MotA/TolQ/ExbB proton channel family protein [Gemmatimonadales bacterium]